MSSVDHGLRAVAKVADRIGYNRLAELLMTELSCATDVEPRNEQSSVSAQSVTLAIPEEVRATIQETVERTGQDFSAVANEMLTEAAKMRRFPGIIFADGPTGRRARIEGTGLEVFEVIAGHRSVGERWEGLRQAFHWLTEQQLRTALVYAEAYPREIERHLGPDDISAIEAVWAAHPETRPPWR